MTYPIGRGKHLPYNIITNICHVGELVTDYRMRFFTSFRTTLTYEYKNNVLHIKTERGNYGTYRYQ